MNQTQNQHKKETGIYICLINIHGLLRGHDLELGRDADTGGQTKYVLELAQALARHPDVDRVEIITRQIIDGKVDDDYAAPEEQIAPNAWIIRLPCGPRRYLRKEVLWPYLDSFADHLLPHFRRIGRIPDIIHGHYADGGYVGSKIAALLGVPFVFTGHSLGRVKRERLLEKGLSDERIESQYAIAQRIEAEELALDNASFVVASTSQEIEQQYALYDDYQPRRMQVIAPGLDLSRFHPAKRLHQFGAIKEKVGRYLHAPEKPMVLTLSRADERKNIATLVRAFGENPRLREMANLVIIAGTREDINTLNKGARKVLTQLFYLIDLYDLHGSVAYPKQHESDEVPELYRLAAKTGGVFVNPALTEPFGLTLLEAAASGLPLVATEDGGPRDIIAHCKNGVLINPLDAQRMGELILETLEDRAQWRRWQKNGIEGTRKHYSWEGHVEKYLTQVRKVLGARSKSRPAITRQRRLTRVERLLICDVDNTLLGDHDALRELLTRIHENEYRIGIGIATGRNIQSTLRILREWKVPLPDLIISSAGSEIYYGSQVTPDPSWPRHIDYRWSRDKLIEAMKKIPGLELQAPEEQLHHKISYNVDQDHMPPLNDIVRELRQQNLHANVSYSLQAYLDLTPIRASKGHALRYIAMKWGLPLDNVLAAGDSGSDIGMLSGHTLGVVVGNHSPELRKLRGKPRIYFAQGHYARGVLEGLEHFNFFGDIRIPEEEE